MDALTCWTGTSMATQPRLTPNADGTVTVRLVFGAWSARPRYRPTITPEVMWFTGQTWQPASITVANLTSAELDRRAAAAARSAADDDTSPDAARLDLECYVQDLRGEMATTTNTYFEVLTDVPAGHLVQFRATASVSRLRLTAPCPVGAVWAWAPTFLEQHVRLVHTRDAEGNLLPAEQSWVLLQQDVRTPGRALTQLRVDLLARGPGDGPWPAMPGFSLSLNGDTYFLGRSERDWKAIPGPKDVWPFFDPSTDSALVTIPIGPADSTPRLIISAGTSTTGCPIPAKTDQDKVIAPTALIILQYAIQGFNDLFEQPIDTYSPPRNYIEITYEDEKGRYSSRPDVPENGEPDGIVYALRAQEAYQVKTQWAFNGGLLTLAKHGLSAAQFDTISRQVRSGLISPSNAGFGAHRPPYYRAETNVKELALGVHMIEELLWAAPDGQEPENYVGQCEGTYDGTYYADQRLYEGTDSEIAAYTAAANDNGLKYLVVDRSTVAAETTFGLTPSQTTLFGSWKPAQPDGDYLWHDPKTKLDLIVIEDDFRNDFLNPSADELARGQLALSLRQRLMAALGTSVGEVRNLFVYGDDLDHCCGDGWFDGEPLSFPQAYLAALRWISTHPWVRATTVSDSWFDPEHYRRALPVPMSSAICPSVDPGGAEYVDTFGRPIHFDTWYEWWKNYKSWWLGIELGTLSSELEADLIRFTRKSRSEVDGELLELAWMFFLSHTHESMWSKQPIESDPNGYAGAAWEPEDFVLSESQQQRHAWTYLNAAIWAAPVAQDAITTSETFVIAPPALLASMKDAGPVLPLIEAAGTADPYWPTSLIDGHGCFWDHDLLATIVLYNSKALIVMDQNGGCITNIFLRRDDRFVTVSGTLKSPQFLSFNTGTPVACDGQRLQNTVWTPNHAYVAADVFQAAPELGTFVDRHGNVDPYGNEVPGAVTSPCWYPDNFNSYECSVNEGAVTFSYGGPLSDAVQDDSWLQSTCAWDRGQRQANLPGAVVRNSTATFTKTITLTDTTLTVSYAGVPAGHQVSNEFCVDQYRAVLQGCSQQKAVRLDPITKRERIELSSNGTVIAVRPLLGCQFIAAAKQTSMPNRDRLRQQEYGELHRVLTDDLRLVCRRGGRFSYEVLLA